MLGVATHPAMKGNGRASYPATAWFRAANASGNRAGLLPACPAGQAPDPGVFTAAVARWRALERLREFRSRLYGCLDRRADALFELADAVLCADHAVTSLVQVSLEPEFTRGHGALYDALSAGRIDDEGLFSLLAGELPQAIDGPEARAWIAEHDVIDRGLLETALAGLPRATPRRCGTHAPGGAGSGSRSTRPPIPAGRVVLPGPGARPQRRLPLQGLVQDRPGLGVPVHRRDRAPAHRLGRPRRRRAHHARDPHSATIAQVKNVLRRLRAAGHGRRPRRCSSSTPATAPPPSPTGSSAARSTSWSGSPPARCSTPSPSPGKASTAALRAAGLRCTAWNRGTSRPPQRAAARAAGRSPCPRTRSRMRPSSCRTPRSTALSAPRPGTASAP